MEGEGQAGRGPDDEYCPGQPEGHNDVSISVRAEPIRWVERCSLCGHISSAKLRAQLKPVKFEGEGGLQSVVYQALGAVSMCWSPRPEGIFDSARAQQIGESLWKEIHRPNLGLATTQELLTELQTRGETDRVAFPDDSLAEDGTILEAVARSLQRSLGTTTLDYSTVNGHPAPGQCPKTAFPFRRCTRSEGHKGDCYFPSSVPAGDRRFA